MLCPKCGAQIGESDKFCSVCGTAAPSSEPQASYTQPESQPSYTQPEPQASYSQPNASYAPPPYSQSQPTYAQSGYAYGQTQQVYYNCGIQTRDIAVAIILSIVTCGIYNIIWLIKQVDDVNRVANDQGAMSGVVTWLLSAVTWSIYGWYWFYQAGKKMRYAKQVRNMPCDENTEVLYLILAIFGLAIVDMALIQADLNKMATPPIQ